VLIGFLLCVDKFGVLLTQYSAAVPFQHSAVFLIEYRVFLRVFLVFEIKYSVVLKHGAFDLGLL